jgi:hypothetical protein
MPSRPKAKDQQGPGIQSPPHYPETTPPVTPSGDYSYTVEIVMNMQHTLGKLSEAVDGLKARQAEQGTKLDNLDKKVYAAIVLVLAFGAILTFFAKSINDTITERIVAPVFQQQSSPTPLPTQESSPTPKTR